MAALTTAAAKLLILPALLFGLLMGPFQPLPVVILAENQVDEQTVEIVGHVGDGEWEAIVENIGGRGVLQKISVNVKHPDGAQTEVVAEYDKGAVKVKTHAGGNMLKSVMDYVNRRVGK